MNGGHSFDEDETGVAVDTFAGDTFEINECRPQLDNPSQLMPDNDDDCALKDHMASQAEEECTLDVNNFDSDNEEDETKDDNTDNNITYTQNALDAASVLAGGFVPTDANFVNTTAAEEVDNCHGLIGRDADGSLRVDGRVSDQQQHVSNHPTSNLAADIAAQLRTHGLSGTGLAVDEVKFVDECDEGKNKKEYDNAQLRYEKRFFQTLAEFGGDILAPLANKKVVNPYNLSEHNSIDHSLYAACGGEKSPDKHEIMNKCFILCGMKWQCLSGSNKGKAIQPISFCKMMQQLACLFNRKGIQCVFNEDFNKKGDFHGVMKKTWADIRKKDPSFGTGSKRARVEKTLVRKFIQAIRDGTLKPYDDPEHCLICVIFVLGYYCGLRGSSEHINLDIENVYIGECTVEDGPELAGLRWAGVKIPFSKTLQLNMKTTTLPKDQDVLLTFVETPHHDCWDPFAVFCHFIRHCHPRAKKFYGRLVMQGDTKEGGKLAKEFGKPIWYAESGHGKDRSNWNLGPSKHRALCKKIAFHAGADAWEQCAGHALRALCIAHCVASKCCRQGSPPQSE